MLLCVTAPVPSVPYVLSPQHLAAPLVVTAQVCQTYAVSAVTPLTSPLTLTGVNRFVLELSPSCPDELLPQHLGPVAVEAQVWYSPAAIKVAPLARPDTST